MRKIMVLAMTLSVVYACTDNNNKPVEQNGADTGSEIPQRPPGNSDADTVGRNRDTSMYQRMPNKTSDSNPQ